jgi:hypothetical protein
MARGAMRGLAVLLALSLLLLACAGATPSGPVDPLATGAASATVEPSAGPSSPGVDRSQAPASLDVEGELCRRIGEVEIHLATLRAVELRLPNRVALEIELGQLQEAMRQLQEAELGPFEAELEGPLRRLGYRLDEVELAVEDFSTNPRPQRAVPHVERDSQTFADELTAFATLARC